MPIFHEPSCLCCGHALPMRSLWKFAKLEQSYVLPGLGFLNRYGLLRGNIGIVCPNCRAEFKVVQTQIRVVRVISWVIFSAIAFLLGAWFRRIGFSIRLEFGILAAALCGLTVLQAYLAPYLAQPRPRGSSESLVIP
jgi:hypothetical protein